MKNYSPKLKLVDILIAVLIGVFIFFMILLYAQDFRFIGYLNASSVTVVLLFSLGWFLFASNHSVFDLPVYGLKQFWLGVFGKRPEKSYYEVVTEKKKVEKKVYIALWVAMIPFVILTITLYIIYYQL